MTLVDLQAGHLDDLLVEDECHGQERECLEPKLQNLISITNGCVTRVDKNVGLSLQLFTLPYLLKCTLWSQFITLESGNYELKWTVGRHNGLWIRNL